MTVERLPLPTPEQTMTSLYRNYGKRILDFTVSAVLFTLAFPLILILCLSILVRLGKPVFFRQKRPGLNAQPFEMIKFRTMTDDRDTAGNHMPDAKRLTQFGAFLRHTSLDELPELWNVIKGDMSLVGPRPLLMEYLPLYTNEQARRHDVRPGITGWAQINGRNTISWDEKFELDAWYVDHISFRTDMKILALTLWKVFRREGISANGEATMPKFSGANPNATK